jgi:hypothetical protein
VDDSNHITNLRLALLNYIRIMKKVKYRSAEHKRKALESDRMVAALEAKWGKPKPLPQNKKEFVWKVDYRGKGSEAPSLEHSGTVMCARKKDKVYTGDLVTGIAVMHKSCLQPIINQQQAIDSARMRRG